MLPKHIVLVRHGQSEGNVAVKASKRGNNSFFTPEFRQRHSSSWRLTDRGIWQAECTGRWLDERFLKGFDRNYVSEYARAQETAFHLNRPEPWLPEVYLRERDHGDIDVLPHDEALRLYGPQMAQRKIDPFYWAPPGNPSQSMADLCLRIDRVLDTIHRECSEMFSIVVVCHGEVMWAFRLRLEKMTVARFRELDASDEDHDQIHNGQVIHYTRINPETDEECPRMGWMRSVCPWDPSLSSNDWQKIERQKFTNDDLRLAIERYPRLING
jgi:NAD+ kinase